MIEVDKETQNLNIKTGYDMIYLVSCILGGILPKKNSVEQMDLPNIYSMAKKHSLTAISYMALESSNVFSICKDVELAIKWRNAKEKAIRKNLMMDAEREEILSFMEGEGIWYTPLKGIILKDMYPRIGMRQMADNDILYDKKYQKELLDFMTARHYEASEIGKGSHDVYHKAPIYNYELHTSLYSKGHDRSCQEYYRNVKQRLIKDEDNNFGYHFSDEDFYIYIITHSYKHYNGSGTGLRFLLDIYVFLEQKKEKLKWNYILVELDKLNIKEFEEKSRELSKKLFSEKKYQLTKEELETFIYYLGSGTYGTIKNSIENKMRKYQPDSKPMTAVTKIKYYLRRLVPDMEYYKNHVYFLYRHKGLIPFFLVFRVLRGLIKNGKRIQKEIQLVIKI
ncbi:nucleotidyltransferase family protein [Haloimpatiens sp. FM7315]|uniref:nucleotidyltransferase domain-containing protein n=1 Tax=Haloimpatiens sp. FM7315 TaxID=3298609 RepID=UPI003709F957